MMMMMIMGKLPVLLLLSIPLGKGITRDMMTVLTPFFTEHGQSLRRRGVRLKNGE
jgi:hypothetical protein